MANEAAIHNAQHLYGKQGAPVSQASVGRTNAGPITLKWRLPGGTEQARDVVREKGGTLKVEIK